MSVMVYCHGESRQILCAVTYSIETNIGMLPMSTYRSQGNLKWYLTLGSILLSSDQENSCGVEKSS